MTCSKVRAEGDRLWIALLKALSVSMVNVTNLPVSVVQDTTCRFQSHVKCKSRRNDVTKEEVDIVEPKKEVVDRIDADQAWQKRILLWRDYVL